MNLSPTIALGVYLALIVVTAAVYDLRRQKIPNLLTYPTMAMGLGCHAAFGGLDGLLFSAAGLATGLGLLMVPYLKGWMGAGDTKLMGAVGAILGAKGAFTAGLFTAVAGGLYAVVLLSIHWRWGLAFLAAQADRLRLLALPIQPVPVSGDENAARPRLCYGVAIAAGTLGFLLAEALGLRLLGG